VVVGHAHQAEAQGVEPPPEAVVHPLVGAVLGTLAAMHHDVPQERDESRAVHPPVEVDPEVLGIG
jgi:hypothetical protein